MMRDVTDLDFDHVVKQAGVPVLVEFWKPGCGSCRALMRELEKLETDVNGKSGLSAGWEPGRKFSSSCG
jgi:thioredoxin 1